MKKPKTAWIGNVQGTRGLAKLQPLSWNQSAAVVLPETLVHWFLEFSSVFPSPDKAWSNQSRNAAKNHASTGVEITKLAEWEKQCWQRAAAQEKVGQWEVLLFRVSLNLNVTFQACLELHLCQSRGFHMSSYTEQHFFRPAKHLIVYSAGLNQVLRQFKSKCSELADQC